MNDLRKKATVKLMPRVDLQAIAKKFVMKSAHLIYNCFVNTYICINVYELLVCQLVFEKGKVQNYISIAIFLMP